MLSVLQMPDVLDFVHASCECKINISNKRAANSLLLQTSACEHHALQVKSNTMSLDFLEGLLPFWGLGYAL